MTKSFRLTINNLYQVLPPWLTGFLLALVLSSLFLWPVIQRFSTHLTSYDDGIFISYTIHWVSQALVKGQNIWQVPIFHPYPDTLAYSDLFIPTSILTIPVLLFTHNLAVIHNLQLFLGSVFLFWGMWLLTYKLCESQVSALAAASIMSFSPMHWHHIVHLHTFLLAGIPFCLYFGYRWLETKRRRYIWLAALCFLYQALNSPATGLFLSFILIPIGMQRSVRDTVRQQWQQLLLPAVVVGILLSWAYLPYFQVSQTFHYTRSIRDAAHFSHSLNRFWQPDVVVLLGILIVLQRWRKRSFQAPTHISLNVLWSIALIGAVLMLGPVLKLNDHTVKIAGLPIPLPHAALYYIIPLFQGIRAVSRWIVLFNFGLSLIIGYYLAKTRLQTISKLALVVFLLLVFGTQIPTLQLYALPNQLPTAYTLLIENTPPEAVVAELPAQTWGMPLASQENERLLWQIHHQRRLFNGTSGFMPPERESAINTTLLNFPSTESIAYLKQQDVTVVLVHVTQFQDWVGQASTQKLYAQLQDALELTSIGCIPDACLYTIN